MSERRINKTFIHAALFVLALAVTLVLSNSARAAPSAAEYVESCRLAESRFNTEVILALRQDPDFALKVSRATDFCANVTQGAIDKMRFNPKEPDPPCVRPSDYPKGKSYLCFGGGVSCFSDTFNFDVGDDGTMRDSRFAVAYGYDTHHTVAALGDGGPWHLVGLTIGSTDGQGL